MCQQRVALQVIKSMPNRGGLTDAEITIYEKQCEDTEIMDKRITRIEENVSQIQSDISVIKEIIAKKNSFWGNLKEVLNNKVFIYILIVIIAISCGMPIAQLGLFLFK